MAIYYVDIINGDNANGGTSWADAWLTIQGNEASISALDEIRIAKTPDPISLGDATFTNKSKVVTLATAVTKTIENCNGNTFTMSANVTGTTQAKRKIGTNSQQFSVLTAFTTGKIGYKTITELDLSSYSKVCLWYETNNLTVFNNSVVKICLCSDTTGDVIVNTVYIGTILQANIMHSIVADVGALGSSIQSIAVYLEVDGGAFTVAINNVFATNSLSLASVIGIGDAVGDTFYGVASVDETTIYIDSFDVSMSGKGYSGASGTVPLYMRDMPVKDPDGVNLTNNGMLYCNKVFPDWENRLTIIGGWNIVSNERDGETWVAGRATRGNGFLGRGGFQEVQYLGFNNYANCFAGTNASRALMLRNCHAVNGYRGYHGFGDCFTIDCKFVGFSLQGIFLTNSSSYVKNVLVVSCTGNSIQHDQVHSIFKNITILNGGSLGIQGYMLCRYYDIHVEDVTNYTILTHASWFTRITSDGSGGIISFGGKFKDVALSEIIIGHYNNIINEADNYRLVGTYGIALGNRMEWDTTEMVGTRPGSWKFVTSYPARSRNQIDYFDIGQIAEIAVEAGRFVSLRAWVKTSNANNFRLIVRPEYSVVAEEVYLEHSIPAGSWTEAAIHFTSNAKGIVTLEIASVFKTGDTTAAHTIWIGGISITVEE